MKAAATVIAVAVAGLFPVAASAQTVGSEVQRDVNQQRRIEQGLKSGSLNTREASQLERGEARIERMEANAAKGNPSSASSQRMQADVQRNVNQQQRIEQGIQSGQLTNREAAKLERGQARVNRAEARAGADGKVGPNEQRRIQKAENRQSKRIYREKHDAQTR